jgi:hypothetical protein
MSYSWFISILLAGLVLTVFLAACKIFNRARLSWFAVPWPFFIAWVVVTWRYVYLVLLWHR